MDYPISMVAIDVTSICNLSCVHCGAPIISESNSDLSTSEIRKLISELAEFYPERVVLSGGEPLTHPDIFEFISQAKSTGSSVYMPSNGLLINEHTAQRLKNAGLDWCVISLDGNRQVHKTIRGSDEVFDKAVNAIRCLKKAGVKVTMKMTIMSLNIDQNRFLIDLAKDLAVDEFALKRYIPAGKKKDNKDWLVVSPKRYKEVVDDSVAYAAEKKVPFVSRDPILLPYLFSSEIYQVYGNLKGVIGGCLAGVTICNVSSIGDVSPCAFVPLSAGNIRNKPFKEIWKNAEIFNKLRARDSLKGKCGSCEFVSVCSGCRAMALALSGDLFGEDPYCLMG